MKRHIIYAGVISAVISTALLGTAFAEPPTDQPPDSTMKGTGSDSPKGTQKPIDKHTDLTGGQQGIPDEYATTPVRQGKLREMTDSKWLQKSVHGAQGDVVGKIKQVLKDQTTGDIEYVILTPTDSKNAVPLRWSQFQEKNGQLQLNMKKEELKTALNATSSKDMSPDIQEYMDQIEQVRSAPKAGAQSQGSATSAPSETGPMGESKTSKGGPSGSQSLPEGKAPSFEGGNPSSKR